MERALEEVMCVTVGCGLKNGSASIVHSALMCTVAMYVGCVVNYCSV